MNRDDMERLAARLRGLRRDRENGLFFGVCAGVAARFDLELTVVRLVALLCLVVAFLPTAVIYLMAGLLVPAQSLTFYGKGESCFWRKGSRRGSRRFCS
jgi:phage shock protein PspC (stress-responsive transcriptional regulator)